MIYWGETDRASHGWYFVLQNRLYLPVRYEMSTLVHLNSILPTLVIIEYSV